MMDGKTKLLLGSTAIAVIGYFGLIYGGCALDLRCHIRYCNDALLLPALCVSHESDVFSKTR